MFLQHAAQNIHTSPYKYYFGDFRHNFSADPVHATIICLIPPFSFNAIVTWPSI